MIDIRYGTAQTIVVGPALDVSDGATPETALTATNEHCTLIVGTTLVIDADLTASGGDNDFIHVTNDDAGYYTLELTVAQTSYYGSGKLSINYVTDHAPIFHELNFMSQEAYDLKYGARKEPHVMFITDIDTVNSQTELELTDGPTDAISCNNMLAKIIDQSDPDQIDVVPISNYEITSPTAYVITLLRAPLFTVAAGDKVEILITEAGIMTSTSDFTDALKTDMQADPTQYEVNVKEVNDVAQTGNDNGADINTLLSRIIGTLATGTHNPQSGDAYARLGAPAGASVSADIAENQTDLNTLLSRLVGTILSGNHNAQSGDSYPIVSSGTFGNEAIKTLLDAVAGYLDTEIQSIIDALATAQNDLDTITGSDGVTLATAQGNYAPSKAGDEMDLVDAPNSTAITAIQNGLATLTKVFKYIQLLARSDAAIEIDNATELGEINANGGSGAGDYSAQTDSQEAIAGSGGGGAPTVEQIRTEMDTNSTKLIAILEDVTGLNGDAMRGTDGANTVVPDAAGVAATISLIQSMTYGDGTLTLSDLFTVLSGIFGGAMVVDLDDTDTGTITFYNQADEAVLTATFTNGSRAKPTWNKVT